MDSDDRESLRTVSFLLIGGGALLAVVVSGVSHDLAILSFGLGPAFAGMALFLLSFFKLEKAKRLPPWRILAFCLLSVVIDLPYLFFDYHLPVKRKPYVLVAYFIVAMLLALWPVKRHQEQDNQRPIAGGGLILR